MVVGGTSSKLGGLGALPSHRGIDCHPTRADGATEESTPAGASANRIDGPLHGRAATLNDRAYPPKRKELPLHHLHREQILTISILLLVEALETLR